MGTLSDVLLIILAILLPPVPVLIRTGCSGQFLLNILLTILGWIPGTTGRVACVRAPALTCAHGAATRSVRGWAFSRHCPCRLHYRCYTDRTRWTVSYNPFHKPRPGRGEQWERVACAAATACNQHVHSVNEARKTKSSKRCGRTASTLSAYPCCGGACLLHRRRVSTVPIHGACPRFPKRWNFNPVLPRSPYSSLSDSGRHPIYPRFCRNSTHFTPFYRYSTTATIIFCHYSTLLTRFYRDSTHFTLFSARIHPVLSRFQPKAYSHSAASHPILPLSASLARNDGIGGGAGGAAQGALQRDR